MIVFLAILGGVALLVVRGWWQHIRREMRHHGTEYMLWRWFSGGLPPWIRNETDRRYRSQFDPGSTHYHAKARMHRAIVRTGLTLGLPFLGIALVTHWQLAWIIVLGIGAALMAEVIWKIRAAERVRIKRRMARHIHKAAAPFANQPVRGKASNWIRFTDEKRQVIKADFPKNANPSEQERARFVQVVTETAGFHPGSEAEWFLEGDDSHVVIKNRKAPPDHVELADIHEYITKNGEDVVTLGLGRGNIPVNVSLKEDSPNFGLSIGAGGGKSQTARTVASQVLYNGGNVLVLDPKRISHAWAKGLPNVRYAASTEEIHAALVWLNLEIERRTEVADSGHNVEGEVLANVGARILVIAEELNEMMVRLRGHWMVIRKPNQPKKSPAITALESALFMGRQIKINTFAVAQMMTALAAGSGAARENMGVRILGRFTRNNWRMLVPEFDMPPRSMKPGRVYVITHKVIECQVAFLTGAEARELSVSGPIVREFPKDDTLEDELPPGDTEVVEGEIVDSEIPALTSGSSNSEVEVEVKPREKVTLSESARKVIPRTLKSLTNARDRDITFPVHCSVRDYAPGRPKEYWKDELIAWHANREAKEND